MANLFSCLVILKVEQDSFFECFDPKPDYEGKSTYMVSYFEKGLCRRDVVDVPCYMNVLPKS